MIAGLLVLGGFALWERWLSARGGQPMIDPELIRSASFTVPAALGGVAGLGMIGLLFTMPQYFQAVLGVSSLGSGLRLLPLVAGLIIGALPAGALAKWLGPKENLHPLVEQKVIGLDHSEICGRPRRRLAGSGGNMDLRSVTT
jgi:DHA2 family multidrug resistance protein-like MFS transporter